MNNLFNIIDLSNIGYNIYDLIYGGFKLTEIFTITGSTDQLKIIKSYGYSLTELKKLNVYSVQQFYDAGFTIDELKKSGYTAFELRNMYTISELKSAGYLINELTNNGYTINNYIDANFTLRDLRSIGYTIQQINNVNNNYTLLDYTLNGYTLTDVSNAYFTDTFSDMYLLLNDYSVDELKSNNIFAYHFISIGYGIDFIISLNYNIKDIRSAGFTAKQIVDIIGPNHLTTLKNVGYTFQELVDAGFSPSTLLPLKFPMIQMKEYNYSLNTLLSYGYTASELRYRKISDILKVDNVYKEYDLSNLTTLFEKKDLNIDFIKLDNSFYYYDYHTNVFTSYTYIYISDDGFLYFSNNKINISEFTIDGTNIQIPINTLRFISRDNLSSVSYKYIDSDNILIYLTGEKFNVLPRNIDDFQVIVNINKNGVISCFYKYISDSLPPPIIGYVGNYPNKTIDDVYLKIVGKNNIETVFNENIITYSGNIENSFKNLLESNSVIFDFSDLYRFFLNDLSGSFTIPQLLEAEFNISEFRNIGIPALIMKQNGVNLQNLVSGNYSLLELKTTGYSAFDLKTYFSLRNLLDVSFNANDLSNCGFTKTDYISINFNVFNLKDIGFKKVHYIRADYSINDLKLGGFKKIDYELTEFNYIDLKNSGFKKIDFSNALYTLFDLKNGGFLLNDFLDADFTIQDLKNVNFTKNNYDTIYCSIYDLLNLNIYTKSELIQLGYSETIINQHKTFVFDISWSVWSSQKPKKYPILNTLYSFQDLSINQITDLRTHITTVTIQWSSFIDSNSNDGLLLNSYHFPFYNEPSFKIRQFGGIPFSRNSANNSNFWQFYKFGGSILANDSPYFLRNTNLTNCFKDSPCRIFNNIENWNTYQVVSMQNMFANASYLNNIYIGFWNFTNTSKLDNIITNTGYNSLQSTIFIEDFSYNLTLRNNSNLGNIPVYLDTFNVRIAIDALNRRNITFEISGNPISYNVTNFKSLGYTTTELKIQGFTISDLVGSGYSISELRLGKYTLPEMQVLNKFTLLEYIDASFSLQELVNSGYNASDLSINNYRAIEYYNLNPRYFNNELKQVFTLNEIINAGYSLTDVKQFGYSLKDILSVPIFNNNTILDYKKIGYSLTDISNAGISFSILQKYSPLPQILKDNSFNVIDFKNINYNIYKLFQLKYSLKDLYDTGYSVEEIENDISLNYLDINFQNIDIRHSIFDYKKAGYSLTDISNGGFSIDSLKNVSPLPQILKDNSFNALEFKNIGYDISYIYYTLKFNGSDLKNAGYTLLEMKDIGISVNDLKIAGFNATDLSNNGYTLENMKGVYNITELVNSGFSFDAIRNVGYNSIDFAYYLNMNQTKPLIVNDFITLLNYGYSITDLSINPIDDEYNFFLFQQIYKIHNETQLSNNVKVQFNTRNAFNELFNNWNDGNIIIQYNLYSFLIYDYYFDLGIQLQNIQKMDFTKNEILMLNYYNYINGLPFISLNTFYNSGFQANKLLLKNIYINNNEINSLFINTDYTFYNRTSPFLYYNEIDYTNLNDLKYNYNNLYQIFNNYLEVTNNNIDILSNAFTFYDSSNNVVTTYNKIIISENGWISLLNNNITLCSIRFFPYDLLPNESTRRFLQYNYDYFDKQVLEINMEIEVNSVTKNIFINFNRNGLITFYSTFTLNTQNLLYSPPDPAMNINCLYYTLPLYYTLDNNQNVYSNYNSLLRFNFGYLYDGNYGYSSKKLLSVGYSLQNLVDASCSAIELRNSGFTASDLKPKGYSINDIISAYNLNIIDLSNLGYTLSDMKQFYFTKKYYENNNIIPSDLFNNNYSIDEFIYIGYTPIDLNGLNFSPLDYLISKIFDRNYIFFSYLVDNVFTIPSLAYLYSYFNEGNNFSTYFYLVEKIYNNLGIEKTYDTGYFIGSNTIPGGTSNDFIDFAIRLQKTVLIPSIIGPTINLDVDYISIYNLIDTGRFTLKNIHDASYTLYDFNYTSVNNRNQTITINYHELIDANYSLREINEYYYNKSLINSNNATYFVFDIINFVKNTPSITYNELVSNLYQFRDISNNRSRNFTQNEKIIIMFNLYGYENLILNNYGIDFILQNHYPLFDLKYLFENDDIPFIPLTKLVNNNYPPYDVFYLYYVIYGYNNFNTIYDLFVTSNISNNITLFYFMSFYYTSFLYNFIFNNIISDYYPNIPNSTSYSLIMNEIIDYGHQVQNMIYYDFSITKYHDSLFFYSPLDLYNNGFEIDLLSPYYTITEFYNSGFTLNIINQYFNYTIDILIDIGYNVSDFKEYGYSITSLYPNYYSLSELKNAGYIIDDFMTIPNITIRDLKNTGFILKDIARFYTKQQLLLEGYSEKELNEYGTVLEYYCKKEACKKTLVSFQKSNTISSKMAYSQNIKNKNVSYSTNYSTYANNINNTALFCVNNNNKVSTSSNQCNTVSNATMRNSYFIRNYITKTLSNAKIIVSNSTMQQSIMHIISIQNNFPNLSFLQILNNYIYIVLQLGFDYPDQIIEYMIINNFTDNVNKIFSKVTDSYMIQYINDILDLYKNNPSFELDYIINTYLSKINTI